jgi:hypothetical protein
LLRSAVPSPAPKQNAAIRPSRVSAPQPGESSIWGYDLWHSLCFVHFFSRLFIEPDEFGS